MLVLTPGAVSSTGVINRGGHQMRAQRTFFHFVSFFLGCCGLLTGNRVRMTKVHPNANAVVDNAVAEEGEKAAVTALGGRGETEVLTVWRKSLLFNGNGFTVFDGKGNLVFRVDNYASENKGEIVLMDAVGKPLLTIRRKKLSLGDHWLIYDGEGATKPRFSAKKHVSFLHSKSLAHIHHCSPKSTNSPSPCSSPKSPFSGGSGGGSSSPVSSPRASSTPAFEVEGSYSQRCCMIYDDTWRQVAEIKTKVSDGGVAYGLDVFRLVVQPGCDAAIAMAIVILLEQMYGSRGSSLLIKA